MCVCFFNVDDPSIVQFSHKLAFVCGGCFFSEHFLANGVVVTAGYFISTTQYMVLLKISIKNVRMCENVSSAIVAHNSQMFALEIEVDPYGSRRLSPDDTLIIDSWRPFLTTFQDYLLHLNYYFVLAAAAVAVAVPVYSIFGLHSH